jgi:hypothetical protein
MILALQSLKLQQRSLQIRFRVPYNSRLQVKKFRQIRYGELVGKFGGLLVQKVLKASACIDVSD